MILLGGAVAALLFAACQQPPEAPPSESLSAQARAATPEPAQATFLPVQRAHRAATALPPAAARRGRARHVHRLPTGVCVTVTPPPPPWAYRADGTLKPPSEIHRFKEAGEQVLFLNFDGAHVTVGNDDPEHNQSHIPYTDVDYPPFDESRFLDNQLDTREKVIDAMVRWVTYFYAHTPVRVTAERPPSGTPYTMILVGGGPEVLGEQTGVLGVATFDCYKDPRNVGFVFSDDHGGNLEMLVLTIVHEAGHTFGLAHIDNPDAIMYPANPGHDAYWGSGSTTDSYACDDTTRQDSLAMLQEMLGVRQDITPPWVEIETPGAGATVPIPLLATAHGSDDVVLYRVELFLDEVSVGEARLPVFDFSVSEVADGEHTLYAVGEDAHGNTAVSEPVPITVAANCAAFDTCAPGLGAVGAPCEGGEDCLSGRCAQSPAGRVCSRACVPDLNPCPFGTDCLPETLDPLPDGGVAPSWCGVGEGPVEVLTAEDTTVLSGCSAAGGPPGPEALLWVLGLGAPLARRRRRGR